MKKKRERERVRGRERERWKKGLFLIHILYLFPLQSPYVTQIQTGFETFHLRIIHKTKAVSPFFILSNFRLFVLNKYYTKRQK